MIAIVTGASTGIGAAICTALVSRGDTVVGIARSETALLGLRTTLGERFEPLPLDVTDHSLLVASLHNVAGRHGRVDVLVNNAGIAEVATITDTTPEKFGHTIDLNLTAPAAAMHALWPTFVQQAGGCIINVSSLAQLDPFPGFFAYAASKAGLHLLTVVAAAEGAEANVRAFTIAPGVVDTPLHRRLLPDSLPAVDGKPSVLQPRDVARVVLETIEGRHDSVTGWVLAVPAPAAVHDVQRWITTHPGGGVKIVS
jgi:NAD(P)-dependent dehydrogenase (short-subunit alcohol dehydrogenase family)